MLLTGSFVSSQSSNFGAQIHDSDYDEYSFLVRFDPSMSETEIELIALDFQCFEEWKSPLTETRLWTIDQDAFPMYYAPDDEWLADIESVRNKSRVRAGGDGGTGFNFLIPGGESGTNPPIAQDHQMDCVGTISNYITTGENPVSLGVFDTGGSKDYIGFGPWNWNLSNVGSGFNYFSNNGTATDDNGHGDHILSTIKHLSHKSYAEGSSAKPEINNNYYKVFNEVGQGRLSEILYGFEQEVIAGLQIANLSWSWTISEEFAAENPFYESIKIAGEDYGVLVICAMGNNGEDFSKTGVSLTGDELLRSYPACYDLSNIISVASFDCYSDYAEFSNYGLEYTHVAAPGINIAGYVSPSNSGFAAPTVEYLSGTSMSSGIVAALAAQLATHQVNFDAAAIKCAILEGADGLIGSNDQGLVINAQKSLDVLLEGCDSGSGKGKGKRIGAIKEGAKTKLFPNPTSNEFNLQLSSQISDVLNVEIYDNLGRLLSVNIIDVVKGLNSISIEVADLPSGTYNVSLNYNENKEIHKLVILK